MSLSEKTLSHRLSVKGKRLDHLVFIYQGCCWSVGGGRGSGGGDIFLTLLLYFFCSSGFHSSAYTQKVDLLSLSVTRENG